MASRRAPLPERPRRYKFAMTPLADAMFQLLIFFMLSSSLAPYSLITLKTARSCVFLNWLKKNIKKIHKCAEFTIA